MRYLEYDIRSLVVLFFVLVSTLAAQSQCAVYVENNTTFDLQRGSVQSPDNATQLGNQDWESFDLPLYAWQRNARLFRVNPSALQSSVYRFEGRVIGGEDTLIIHLILDNSEGEEELSFSISSGITASPYFGFSPGEFHQTTWTLYGKPIHLRFTMTPRAHNATIAK